MRKANKPKMAKTTKQRSPLTGKFVVQLTEKEASYLNSFLAAQAMRIDSLGKRLPADLKEETKLISQIEAKLAI